MKALGKFVLFLLAGAAALHRPVSASEPVVDFSATAELVELQPATFDCGIVRAESLAAFRFTSPPPEGVKKTVKAYVSCIEMQPALVVGRPYFVHLSKVDERSKGAPRVLPDADAYFVIDFKPAP